MWREYPEKIPPNYGYGLAILDTLVGRAVRHGGSFPGISLTPDVPRLRLHNRCSVELQGWGSVGEPEDAVSSGTTLRSAAIMTVWGVKKTMLLRSSEVPFLG
jgi:hypothetical protein